MNWLTLALATILFYSVFDLFVKLSSNKIHDGLGAFLINLISAFVVLIYLIFANFRGEKIFMIKPGGLLFSTLAGIMISLASIFFLKMFATGTNLSVGVPLVRIGIVLIATILGLVVLKEGFNVRFLVGFFLAIFGLYILVTAR